MDHGEWGSLGMFCSGSQTSPSSGLFLLTDEKAGDGR